MISRGRVLFLTQTHNIWGGMEQWLDAFMRWLAEHGWDVWLGLAKGARYNRPEPFLDAHPRLPARVLEMDASAGTERARVRALTKAWRECGAEIVVPIGLGAVFPAVRQLKREGAGLRLVVPVRSHFPDYLQNVLDNWDTVDQVVGVNRLIERFFRVNRPDERLQISYVRHGVRPPLAERGSEATVLRAGFVGRLAQLQKRVRDLVGIAECLSREDVGVEFRIYGDGPEREGLAAFFANPHGAVTGVLDGYLPKERLYEQAYPRMDVLLVTSDEEAGPFALYEGMRNGVVPVVSRYVGHASEGALRSGWNCLTFPVGDTVAAAELIKQLAGDREFRRRLARQATEDGVTYDEERMHRDWQAILDDVRSRDPVFPVADASDVPKGGRLERFGVPAMLADGARRVLGRRHVFDSGFGEWPGTQFVTARQRARVIGEMRRLEEMAARPLYEPTVGGHDTSLGLSG